MEQLVTYSLQNDLVFLALFTITAGGLAWLVRWVLKTSGEREARYLGVIDGLTEKFGIVKAVDQKLDNLKEDVNKKIDIMNDSMEKVAASNATMINLLAAKVTQK